MGYFIHNGMVTSLKSEGAGKLGCTFSTRIDSPRSAEELERRELCGDKDTIRVVFWLECVGGAELKQKNTSDSESTQLNALIIVPLHFLWSRWVLSNEIWSLACIRFQ